MRLLASAAGACGLFFLYSGLTRPSIGTARPLARLDALAAEAGLRRMRGGGLIALSGLGCVAAFVVTAAIVGSAFLAAAGAGAAAAAPVARCRSRRTARRRSCHEAWPDALASIISGIRAGLALPECCAALAEKGPEDLQLGFSAFAATYRASGSFEAGLLRVQEELQDPIADRVVTVLRMAHEVGGTDLVRILRTTTDFIREDLRVRNEIQARWSWTVTAARVAAGAPFAVLLVMGLRPEAAMAYNSSAGVSVIGAGTFATVLGYRLMLRAARLPDDQRLR